MTGVFVVVRSVWADWADHPSWHEEEGELTLERGYFRSTAAAQAWIDAQLKRKLDHERDNWRNSLAAEEAKSVQMNNSRRGRQREWDAIKLAGLTPSFRRPSLVPFEAWPFDEEKIRKEIGRAESWTIEEIQENGS